METYTASARREGKFWQISIHGLPVKGTATLRCRTWEEAYWAAVRLVASLLDVSHEAFDIRLVPEDPRLADLVQAAAEAKAIAEAATQNADQALARAAQALTNVTTVRDAGYILGYSHQYIARLSSKTEG
jgi:hypothetical protein